jgi:Tfp pilus assembly protein PilX
MARRPGTVFREAAMFVVLAVIVIVGFLALVFYLDKTYPS